MSGKRAIGETAATTAQGEGEEQPANHSTTARLGSGQSPKDGMWTVALETFSISAQRDIPIPQRPKRKNLTSMGREYT